MFHKSIFTWINCLNLFWFCFPKASEWSLRMSMENFDFLVGWLWCQLLVFCRAAMDPAAVSCCPRNSNACIFRSRTQSVLPIDIAWLDPFSHRFLLLEQDSRSAQSGVYLVSWIQQQFFKSSTIDIVHVGFSFLYLVLLIAG